MSAKGKTKAYKIGNGSYTKVRISFHFFFSLRSSQELTDSVCVRSMLRPSFYPFCYSSFILRILFLSFRTFCNIRHLFSLSHFSQLILSAEMNMQTSLRRFRRSQKFKSQRSNRKANDQIESQPVPQVGFFERLFWQCISEQLHRTFTFI